MAIDTLPNYMERKVADNTNFINQSITLTIWRAEGVSIIVVGKQEGAPVVDVHLDAERR
jgi:K+/H+ antiporter YhaU regulatory subunit KhtT